jgi:hypothetical protein
MTATSGSGSGSNAANVTTGVFVYPHPMPPQHFVTFISRLARDPSLAAAYVVCLIAKLLTLNYYPPAQNDITEIVQSLLSNTPLDQEALQARHSASSKGDLGKNNILILI